LRVQLIPLKQSSNDQLLIVAALFIVQYRRIHRFIPLLYGKMTPPSGINVLLRRYRSDQITPQQLIRETYDRIEQSIDADLWITLTPLDEVLQRVTDLTQEFSKSLPLYGIPFAIHDKTDGTDNPIRSAQFIKNLLAAGAIPMGRTHFDPLVLEFVHFVLGAQQEGDDRRSAILALTDSDVEIVLKSTGF
jgi:hypothetical protein